MDNRDFNEFREVMRDARDTIGQGEQYTEGSLDLMFAALADLTLSQIKQALVDHINDKINGKWRPNASYIRAQVERRQPVQWIGADEAWAQVPKLETEPGLLNQVTSCALAAAAEFLDIPRPDMNAARMAFRAAYDRLVEQEKLARRPPRYWVSPAGSIEAQNAVRDEGIRLGLLNATWAPAAAPQLGNSTPPPGAMEALRGFSLKALPKPEAE